MKNRPGPFSEGLTEGLLRPSHLPYAGLFCAAVVVVSSLLVSGDWQ
jgi:hypothetical protein